MLPSKTTLAICLGALPGFASAADNSTAVDSPDLPFPEQWVDILNATYDNVEFFYNLLSPDTPFMKNHNWVLDQIVDGNGTVNVCMRWNSNTTLDEESRHVAATQHAKQFQQWLQWLPGWDNFPFTEVNFNIIAWAVANDDQLIGNRDDFHVYTEFKDQNGAPTCDPGCSRQLITDDDYSGCGRGEENRIHHYFLVDNSWGEHDMGSASSLGISVSEYGFDTVGRKLEDRSILVHEVGHNLGNRDCINNGTDDDPCSIFFMPANITKHMVMEPTEQDAHIPLVTRFEGWLTQYPWSRLFRTRGWQADDSMSFPPITECPPLTRALLM